MAKTEYKALLVTLPVSLSVSPHLFYLSFSFYLFSIFFFLFHQLNLKDCTRKLTPYIHEGTNGITFDEKNPHALELCSRIEKCFFHGHLPPAIEPHSTESTSFSLHSGIKITEFYGTFPFWGLLERLETSVPPILPVRNSVGAVACISTLRTPIGKARGWIRQALNSQCLEVMIGKTHLTSSFFFAHPAISFTHQTTPRAALFFLSRGRSLKSSHRVQCFGD
jgi:hypothetical protein